MNNRFYALSLLLVVALFSHPLLAQKQTTITIQTNNPDGSQGTKTITIDSDSDEEIDWNEIINETLGEDEAGIVDINMSGDNPPAKPFLGVTYEMTKKGIVVTELVSEGAAQKAGMAQGDVIKEMNGVVLQTGGDLRNELNKYKPNETVSLTVFRGGKPVQLQVVLGQMECDRSWNYDPSFDNQNWNDRLAIEIEDSAREIEREAREIEREMRDVERELRDTEREVERDMRDAEQEVERDARDAEREAERDARDTERSIEIDVNEGGPLDNNQQRTVVTVNGKPRLGITVENSGNGLRIETVQPDGPAAEGALRSGDEIISVDGKVVEKVQDLLAELDIRQAGDSIQLRFKRGNEDKTVQIRLRDFMPQRRNMRYQRNENFGSYGNRPSRGRSITIEKRIKLGDPVAPAENELLLERLDLYPNPTTNELRVKGKANNNAPLVITIMATDGKIVIEHSLTPTDGSFEHVFSLIGQPAGTYSLTIKQGDKLVGEQILITE